MEGLVDLQPFSPGAESVGKPHAQLLAAEGDAHDLAQRQGRGAFKNLLLLTVASALIGMYFSGK